MQVASYHVNSVSFGQAVRMWAVSNYLNEGQRADMPTIQDILGTGTRR